MLYRGLLHEALPTPKPCTAKVLLDDQMIRAWSTKVTCRSHCLGIEMRVFSSTEVFWTPHCWTSPSPELKSQLHMTKRYRAAAPRVRSLWLFTP